MRWKKKEAGLGWRLESSASLDLLGFYCLSGSKCRFIPELNLMRGLRFTHRSHYLL